MGVQAIRISIQDIFLKMYAKYLLRLLVMMALAATGMVGIEGLSYYYDKKIIFLYKSRLLLILYC